MHGPPEFQLLSECCRSNFDKSEAAKAVRSEAMDWPPLVRLARFHRVQGLVWAALSSLDLAIPDHARLDLSEDSVRIATDNLRSAAEASALRKAFENAGLPHLFVKGLTLAQLAYGTIATKAGVDIDLLIEPARLADASAQLRQLGYRLSQPGDGINIAKLERWHRLRKESTWIRSDRGLQIDLHTRLADNPALIPAIDVASPRQMIEIAPGIDLPTLAREELFAYLAVHGASSAWFRLKWITDFAALIHGCSPEELVWLYRRSQELGAALASAQALLLADRIYGTLDESPSLRQTLGRDGRTRRLVRTALSQLLRTTEPLEPTERPFGTAAIHVSQFLLLPGSPLSLSELIRQARASLA